MKGEGDTIGLISDTHGLLRPEAVRALHGVAFILHGGDIGKAEVLDGLRNIAPVYAIRGNNDHGPWADALPDILRLHCGAVRLQVIHNVHDLALKPNEHCDVVISGHSHKPSVQDRGGILYVNAGSAGPRRFKLPIVVGKLRIAEEQVNAEIIDLKV